MTEEPDNLVLQLLREIRATQDAIMKRLDAIETRLDKLEKRAEQSHREITYALGMIVNAERIAHDALQQGAAAEKRIDEMFARIEALEAR